MSEHATTAVATGDGGAVIRALVALRGARMADLPAVLGISSQAVYDRLNGKVDFRRKELAKLAEYLDVPVFLLLLEPADALQRLSSNPMYSSALSSLTLEGVHSLHLFDPEAPEDAWNKQADVAPVREPCSDFTQVEPAPTLGLDWREVGTTVGLG